MLQKELKFAVRRLTPENARQLGSYIYNSALNVTINIVCSLLR